MQSHRTLAQRVESLKNNESKKNVMETISLGLGITTFLCLIPNNSFALSLVGASALATGFNLVVNVGTYGVSSCTERRERLNNQLPAQVSPAAPLAAHAIQINNDLHRAPPVRGVIEKKPERGPL